MAKVIYAPESDDDIFGIVEFIARDKPEAARNWMQKFARLAIPLRSSPTWVKNLPDSVFPDVGRSVSVVK